MSATAGVYVLHHILLPDSTRSVLERLASERDVAVDALLDEATGMAVKLGADVIVPREVGDQFNGDRFSLNVYACVRWWLDRSPQRERIAAIVEELVADVQRALDDSDAAGCKAGCDQLAAIIRDPSHPAQAAAIAGVPAVAAHLALLQPSLRARIEAALARKGAVLQPVSQRRS